MKGNVLVFGGSGFAGRATVRRLLEAGYAVTMANRQQPHWGDANPLQVPVVQCDRAEPEQVTRALGAQPEWTFVVDFTSFQVEDVAPILAFYSERDKLPHYVMISTDNVYNVSTMRTLPEQEEDFAVFPTDAKVRDELCAADDYGAGKLRVEQLLCSRFSTTAMRLPDVFGPYDESRIWKYFLWLSVADQFPVFVKTERQCSFVFSEDVARCAVAAVDGRVSACVNVADKRRATLREFLEMFAASARFKHTIRFTSEESEDAFCEEFLPSVDYNVSVAKLASVMPAFEATRMEEALRQTAAFYRRAWDKYPTERLDVLSELPHAWHNAIKRRAVAMADEDD